MKLRSYIYSVLLLQALFLSAATTVAFAASDKNSKSKSTDTDASASNVDALIKELQMQGQRLADQEKKLADQEKELAKERVEFEKLQTRVIAATGKPIPVAAKTPAAAGKQPVRADTQTGASAPAEVGTERKQNQERPPEIAAVIDEGGVLAGKGKLIVTPSLEYDHSSATRVSIDGFSIIPAVNIGLFDISNVNRDIVNPAIGVRYGVTNRFEVEAKVPYVYRVDATDTRPVGVANAPETLTTVSGHGIGDVEFGAHYQVNRGQGGWPFLVANMRVKSATGTSPFEVPVVNGVQTDLPTGSGFWAFQPSITAIYPSDPVVYYTNWGYLHSLGRNFPIYGKIQPGDSFSGSFGMSLSLNDKSSVSLGYSHTMVLKTMENDFNIPNSNVLQIGSLDLGYSYNLTDKTNLNFTVSAGLTADAPDVRLIFRVPMTFDLN